LGGGVVSMILLSPSYAGVGSRLRNVWILPDPSQSVCQSRYRWSQDTAP